MNAFCGGLSSGVSNLDPSLEGERVVMRVGAGRGFCLSSQLGDM